MLILTSFLKTLNLKKVPGWIFILCLFPFSSFCQEKDIEIILLKKLDSISKSKSVASYFASLYFETTTISADFFKNTAPATKSFIERFEKSFAGFFFRAAEANIADTPVPAVWRDYYADSALSVLQYKLLGINAHINGDLWQALTSEFTAKEIADNHTTFLNFQKGLQGQYQRFYDENVITNPTISLLNNVTLGLARTYGKMMLSKWRKRQYKLAILHYTDQVRFRQIVSRVNKKREQISRLILKIL